MQLDREEDDDDNEHHEESGNDDEEYHGKWTRIITSRTSPALLLAVQGMSNLEEYHHRSLHMRFTPDLAEVLSSLPHMKHVLFKAIDTSPLLTAHIPNLTRIDIVAPLHSRYLAAEYTEGAYTFLTRSVNTLRIASCAIHQTDARDRDDLSRFVTFARSAVQLEELIVDISFAPHVFSSQDGWTAVETSVAGLRKELTPLPKLSRLSLTVSSYGVDRVPPFTPFLTGRRLEQLHLAVGGSEFTEKGIARVLNGLEDASYLLDLSILVPSSVDLLDVVKIIAQKAPNIKKLSIRTSGAALWAIGSSDSESDIEWDADWDDKVSSSALLS